MLTRKISFHGFCFPMVVCTKIIVYILDNLWQINFEIKVGQIKKKPGRKRKMQHATIQSQMKLEMNNTVTYYYVSIAFIRQYIH